MCPAPWKDLLGPLALNTTSRDDPSSAASLQVLPVCDLGVSESLPVYTVGVTVGPQEADTDTEVELWKVY